MGSILTGQTVEDFEDPAWRAAPKLVLTKIAQLSNSLERLEDFNAGGAELVMQSLIVMLRGEKSVSKGVCGKEPSQADISFHPNPTGVNSAWIIVADALPDAFSLATMLLGSACPSPACQLMCSGPLAFSLTFCRIAKRSSLTKIQVDTTLDSPGSFAVHPSQFRGRKN